MTLFLHSNFYTACCARAGRLDYQHRHHFFSLNWSKTKKTNAAAPPPLFWIWVFKQNRKKGNPHHRHCSLLTVNICPSFTKPLLLQPSLRILFIDIGIQSTKQIIAIILLFSLYHLPSIIIIVVIVKTVCVCICMYVYIIEKSNRRYAWAFRLPGLAGLILTAAAASWCDARMLIFPWKLL